GIEAGIHVGRQGKWALEVEVRHVLHGIQPGLHHFPAQTGGERQLWGHLVRFVEVKTQAVFPVLSFSELKSQIQPVRVAQDEIRRRIPANQSLRVRRVIPVELGISPRILITVLSENIVTVLTAEAKRMLASVPREVVQHLRDAVVDNEWSAGVV